MDCSFQECVIYFIIAKGWFYNPMVRNCPHFQKKVLLVLFVMMCLIGYGSP
jgi:hypothetical protein